MRNVDEAVCFAPVGIGTNVNDFLERYGSKTPASKIINYNNPKDFWTNRFRNRLYGTNYTIGAINQHGDNHTLENMKPLYGIPSALSPANVGSIILERTLAQNSESTKGTGETAPIPPVLGPLSPSPILL